MVAEYGSSCGSTHGLSEKFIHAVAEENVITEDQAYVVPQNKVFGQ